MLWAKGSSLTKRTLSPCCTVIFLVEKALFFWLTTCSPAFAWPRDRTSSAKARAVVRRMEDSGGGVVLRRSGLQVGQALLQRRRCSGERRGGGVQQPRVAVAFGQFL